MISEPGKAQRVNIATWERRSVFEFFRTFSDPFHSVCVRVDCTETFRLAKREHLSVFLSLVQRALVAANEIDNLKLRVTGGEVWQYETIHAGTAVGRENGTIGFAHFPFRESLGAFVTEASPEMQRVKLRDDVERYHGQDIIRFSVLPWLDFTSLSHAMDSAKADTAPRITFGKISEADGRCTMPVSIHVHHALVDGSHVATFVKLFERHLRTPNAIYEK